MPMPMKNVSKRTTGERFGEVFFICLLRRGAWSSSSSSSSTSSSSSSFTIIHHHSSYILHHKHQQYSHRFSTPGVAHKLFCLPSQLLWADFRDLSHSHSPTLGPTKLHRLSVASGSLVGPDESCFFEAGFQALSCKKKINQWDKEGERRTKGVWEVSLVKMYIKAGRNNFSHSVTKTKDKSCPKRSRRNGWAMVS